MATVMGKTAFWKAETSELTLTLVGQPSDLSSWVERDATAIITAIKIVLLFIIVIIIVGVIRITIEAVASS